MPQKSFSLTVPLRDKSRLDSFLSQNEALGLSRSQLKKYIQKITVNCKPAKMSQIINSGDKIELTVDIPSSFSEAEPQQLYLDAVFEDEDLIVINKPFGMPVHPSHGHPHNTLVNGLLYHCSTLPGDDKLRPGIVHRLDKDTSGLIICAKTQAAMDALSLMFQERQIQKEYTAIVKGRMNQKKGDIKEKLGRDKYNRKKMAVTADGKLSHTGYSLLREFSNHSLLRIFLYTGRTHQIRVHLKHIGHPIIGDPIYSRSDRIANKLCLAATKISFIHPLTKDFISLEIDLPEHMNRALEKLTSMDLDRDAPAD